MTKHRIVLDTNVILSAILCGGNPAEYFALASSEVIEIFSSPFILGELSRILGQKFRWTSNEVEEVVNWYRFFCTLVDPPHSVHQIQRQDSDNRILECALEARADLLVTGDKRDLLPLKEFQGIRIVSPIEGLALLME